MTSAGIAAIPLSPINGRAHRASTDKRGDSGKSVVHVITLACVALMVITSSVVFSEPAPVDVLMAGLIILLPTVGLARLSPGLGAIMVLWLVVAAGGYVSSMMALNTGRAITHVSVTLFLCAGSILIAAFVARKPDEHTRLIMNAWIAAALIAAIAGIIGYFDALPKAHELFTVYGRARGPFKDPNVFGPFLIPVMLYCLLLLMNNRLGGKIGPALMLLICALAVLLSFSRGAWINLVISVSLFGYLTFLTARDHKQRMTLVGLGTLSVFAAALAVAAALQIEQVAELMEVRAAVTHSYDVGPYGRFGGQAKAFDLILSNPLGIGSQEFVPRFHHEEPHNVYISMFLNHGWIGGSIYLALVIATVAFGFRFVFSRSAAQPLFVVAYAAFVGNAIEGVVIDTDHWRHFFMLFGLCWGLMLAPEEGRNGRSDRI